MAARKIVEEYCGSCGKLARKPWIVADMRRRSGVELARAAVVGSARRIDLITGAVSRNADLRAELRKLRELLIEHDLLELEMWGKRDDRAAARERRAVKKKKAVRA